VGDVHGQDGYEWVSVFFSGTGSSRVVPDKGSYIVVCVCVRVVI